MTYHIIRPALAIILFTTSLAYGKPSKKDSSQSKPSNIGLVAHWTFDSIENGMIKDVSGNNNHGKVVGAVLDKGVKGNSLRFTSKENNHVVVENNPSLNIEGPDLTFMARIKPASFDSVGRTLLNKDRQYTVNLKGQGISYSDSALWSYSQFGTHGQVTLNTWQHVAVTRGNGKVEIYINGDLAGSKELKGNLAQTAADVILGSYGSGASKFGFDGQIDEIYLYKRTLTPAEIRQQAKANKRYY